jgi:hypothetical protein
MSEEWLGVAVEWWDSESECESPWGDCGSVESFAREKMVPARTQGILVHRDSESITVALSATGKEYGPHIKIPLLCVKRLGQTSITWE